MTTPSTPPLPLCPPPCPITALNATNLSKAIHAKTYSCVEVMNAYLDRIQATNATFNAFINMRDRGALMTEAKAHDKLLANGQSKGWMHGFPQAIKDLASTKDTLTVMGSPLLTKNQPLADGLMVQRMKDAGSIVIGKTNVPEFGLGSHTFNPVFGATKNAYNLSVSAGGSSGGAAVGLATHTQPVADGSDFMGSLRNPAAWNNIYGMRPSQGRIPMHPAGESWISQLGIEGPMGRTVEDVVRLLDTQSGYDARNPLSLTKAFDLQQALTPMAAQEIKNLRILWLGDLVGYLPTEDGILSAGETALQASQDKGCRVDVLESRSSLGFQPEQVWEAWLTWRHVLTAQKLGSLSDVPSDRSQMKPEALWEIDNGRKISAMQFSQAAALRTSFYVAMTQLLDTYDVLALPTNQVHAFDINLRSPMQIKTTNGMVQMDTYHRWQESLIYATFAGLPAISVPAGFNAAGTPVGIQLIGRPTQDEQLLRIAAALSQ